MDPVSGHAPDWAALQRDVNCPLCGYNLRGLTEPRCPECGYRFQWQEVLDAHFNAHAFVFDSADRPAIKNLLHTFSASFRPRRFWTDLQPKNRLIRWRLVAYLLFLWMPLIGAAGYVAGREIAPDVSRCIRDYLDVRKTRQGFIAKISSNPRNAPAIRASYGSIEGYAAAMYPMRPFYIRWASLLIPDVLSLPAFLCFLPALLIFQWTMWSRSIRWSHVLRCVAYSSQFIWILGVVVTSLAAAEWHMRLPDTPMLQLIGPRGQVLVFVHTSLSMAVFHDGTPVIILLTGWPLLHAYRRYMRFDHAFATVASVQIIVLLVWAIAEFRVWNAI